MPVLRLTLAAPVESRDSLTTKDSKIVNGYIEQESAEVFHTIKRPGLKLEATRTNTGQAIFAYGTKVYIWDASTTATTPASINISSLT